MPQKPLLKAGKKIQKQKAASKHGKGGQTKKGRLTIAPKKPALQSTYKEQKELTKMINKSNESHFATKAQEAGGHLAVIKGPAPVLAPADQKQKAKAAKKK